MRYLLYIFSKAPIPGAVMTRLTPALTPEQACDVHRASLRCVWNQARYLRDTHVVLAGTPDEAAPEFSRLLNTAESKLRYVPQGAGDLGVRLHRAFDRAFDQGYLKVAAIGTDSPHVAVSALSDAWHALETADVTLGPTEDGGYYLIAMNRPCPCLFEEIQWGTGRVTAQTLERAHEARLSVKCLPLGYDLDRPDDLQRVLAETSDGGDDPEMSQWRRDVAKILRDSDLIGG